MRLPASIQKKATQKNTFLLISGAFYAVALFPGRIYRDSTFLLEQMRISKSSDQWTALYFRYLQITTFNGRYLFLNAILGLTILILSFHWFMSSLAITKRTFNTVTLLVVASPFVGVFGMTVGHDTTTASGVLLLLGTLVRIRKQNDYRIRKKIIFFGLLLSSTSFLGLTAIIGFAIALGLIRKKALSALIIGLTLINIFFGSLVLNVSRTSDNLMLTSLLGDIKCIAQHPDAKISEQQWVSLDKLAPESEWKSPTSCWIADNAYFALGESSKNPRETVALWARLASQNPQISLMAHIQRASVALPPIFFSPPPNMIENDYAMPIGSGTKDDLQRYSELFKTSVDDSPSKKMRLPFQSPLEYLVLFFTFIFNQHSAIWGWAGLWLATILIFGRRISGLKIKDLLLSISPIIAMHLAMALVSPAPNPRYLMATILIGISFSLALIIEKPQSFIS